MDTSRDSSVWRSLAVTFGGGLALGAVGMKLTQGALRPAEAPVELGLSPLSDRLNRIEHRIERIEHAPAVAAPAPAQQFDQKVLEAVVSAVDARLHEHAGQVERRLAELEARMTAELQSLHEQDRHIADEAGKRFMDVQNQFRHEVADLRTAVGEELGQFGKAVPVVVANQVASQVEVRAAALEQSIEARIVTAAAAAAAAQFEEQLAPLRVEVERKEQELAELRLRLTESEHSVLDVILAIGQVCRQAAERMGGSTGKPAVAESEAPPAPASRAIEASPEEGAEAASIAPEESDAAGTPPPIPPAPDTSSGQALPGFAEPAKPGRLWRIPLVSSFVFTLGGLLLMHYL